MPANPISTPSQTQSHTSPPQQRVDAPPAQHWRKMALGFGVPIIIALIFWFSPHPEALTDQAWRMFGIFVATIVCIIMAPMPMGAVTIIGMIATVLTGIVPLSPNSDNPGAPYALVGFGNSTIWLIVMAFLLSRGFIKTGFGRRVALFSSPKSADTCWASVMDWGLRTWCCRQQFRRRQPAAVESWRRL